MAPTFHLVVKPSVRSLKKQTSTQSIKSTSHGSSTTTTTTSTDSTNAFTENITTANTPLPTNLTNTTQPLVQPMLHSGYHLVAIK